jgi:hypothetical protein
MANSQNPNLELNGNDTPLPPPPIYTGDHYGRLALYALPLIAIFIWLLATYVYGFVTQPLNTLAEGKPLVREVPDSQIPVLPDDLAAEYDAIRAGQLAQISNFQWVDQAAGIGSIPVEDAYDILIAREAAR